MQIGQQNDPRRFQRETKEQRENRVTSKNVDDDTVHYCSVCGLDEFVTRLVDVGGGKLECFRCSRES